MLFGFIYGAITERVLDSAPGSISFIMIMWPLIIAADILEGINLGQPELWILGVTGILISIATFGCFIFFTLRHQSRNTNI